VDALLYKSATDVSYIDAILSKAIISSLNVDAQLLKAQTAITSIDASLYWLQTIDTNLDAILYSAALGGTETTLLDALLSKLDQQINLTLDASIYRRVLNVAVIDSILKGTLSRQVNIEALLKKEMTSSTLLDAVIYSVLIQANPFVSFVTTEEKPSFITTEEKPSFVFQLD
jgi:hypothetical protein